MTPTVVTFKWKPKTKYRSVFTSQHVNTLAKMVRRYYPALERFVCLTDDPKGLDPRLVEPLPLWNDYADVVSPHGAHQPSCYRRLKLFQPGIESLLGPRFVALDLDTVVVGDLTPLFERPEPFVCWGETDPRSWYNCSMFMLTAGARARVWDEFDPKKSPAQSKAAGNFGSDQGWISHILGPGEATWTTKDGVYSFRVHITKNNHELPANARIVMFHGRMDPWSEPLSRYRWIRTHYTSMVAA